MNSKKVLIPLDLLLLISELLRCLDISACDSSTKRDYYKVTRAILEKLQATALHDAYTAIVSAKNDVEKHRARSEYYQLRQIYRR